MLYGGYFMKRSFWQHTLATLALVVALPAAVFAQPNPVVVNENNVVIGDGAAAQGYLMTEFPATEVGDSSQAFFTVINQGDADLEVGFITGSAQFVVVQPTLANTTTTLAPGGELDFSIAFTPAIPGPNSLDIVVPTNAPSAESEYTVKVSGVGYAPGTLPTQPNIGIEWAEKKGIIAPLKVKLDKKTGQYKITGSAVVTNNGPIEIALANVEVWYSTDDVLDESVDQSLGLLKKPLSKIKVAKTPKPGKPIKYAVKKAKIQVLSPNADGYIFLKAFLVSPDDQEVTELDNVVSIGYPIP
jgi:hypothetical protein